MKIFVVVGLTLFVLCLNVNGKPLFEPVYSALSHLVLPLQKMAGSVLGGAANATRDYSQRLFNNSVPKLKDAVKSRASAPKRGAGGPPSETILVEEKEELDELIKSHH